MDPDALRRLHYITAIACGVFAALALHIVLTVLGLGMDKVLRDAALGTQVQLVSALAWWATAAAGFAGGWATSAYLIAAARERTFVYRMAQRFLIALVFAVPAAVAGYSAAFGLAHIGIVSHAWCVVLGVIGALFTGGTALVRLAAAHPETPLPATGAATLSSV